MLPNDIGGTQQAGEPIHPNTNAALNLPAKLANQTCERTCTIDAPAAGEVLGYELADGRVCLLIADETGADTFRFQPEQALKAFNALGRVLESMGYLDDDIDDL